MNNETLTLTISVDDGKIFVLLTDTKRFSRQGWARTDLQNIRDVAATVEPPVLQDLIFPVSINQAIEKSGAEVLQVQIQSDLAFLPIESFQSHGQRWCERYAMACYLPGPELPKNLPFRATNPVHQQIQVSFTTSLRRQDNVSVLASHLTGNGFFFIENDSLRRSSTALVALSANDAAKHIRESANVPPELCIWPTDSSSDTSGTEVAEFSTEFPGCAIVTGWDFTSIEDLILASTQVLSAINTGLTPRRAVQIASQSDENTHRILRLYNCDDNALCAPRSITQLETENRTITAMSLDLVNSTKMMQKLGNERYSEVLATLKERSIKCIYDRGGSSGGRAGDDSTMAYFGLPSALENTASCALDTAMAVRALLPILPGQPELRIGIATGRVAVRSGVPYGEPIHLAARLQTFGQPGDITVDTNSQWLAREKFEFEPSGDYTKFHGIDHPVLPMRLISYARDGSASTAPRTSMPFLGRDDEILELTQSWHRVCRGEQTVVCVRGEAGIGKSRLVREFLATVLPEGARLFKIQGLSDYQGGVFYSLKESLRRGFGIQIGDSQLQVRQRIQEFASYPPGTVRNIAVLAELLGITKADEAQPDPGLIPAGSPELTDREHLFELMTEAIDIAARDKPLILMVDDLQWVDPSLREALEHVIDVLSCRSGLRFMVLCTERDGLVCNSLPSAENLKLGRLPVQVAYQFMRTVVGNNLASDAVNRLVTRAEGVPLFLEESARLALDQPHGISDSTLVVPDSIDALLKSRLEHLDKAGKYLVRVASVIGRDVPIELLRAVVFSLTNSYSLQDFQSQIDSFRELGILVDSKSKGLTRLSFRHEMIRDVAYSSMWERHRIPVHAAIARVIQHDQDHMFDGQPGMLAHHLSSSNQHQQGAKQWEIAAHLAADASANQEAIHSLRSALVSLEKLTSKEETAEQEMRLQLMLAARLIASEGYGSEEVRSAYERADTLVRQFGNQREQLKVMLGLETVHVMRGELEKAEALAIAADVIASDLSDQKSRILMVIQCRWALGNIKFHQGHTKEALLLMDQCLKDCRSTRHSPAAVQDPEIMCLCYGAWSLWDQGYSDTADIRSAQAVNLAKSRKHPFSEAEAHGFYASLAMFRGEYATAIDHADNAIAICEKENFLVWLAHARIIRGRSMALTGYRKDALIHMDQGYAEWVSTGAVITRAFYLSLIAETLLEEGELDTAIEKIVEAEQIIIQSGDRYHLAEVLRIQGLIAYEKEDIQTGDALMHQSLDVANKQQKQAYVLRTSMALAESLALRERYTEANTTVTAALSALNEGDSTHDVKHAHALLSRWATLSGTEDSSQSPSDKSGDNRRSCILPFPQIAND
ncbi:MAG: AAA family ATPase [Granulosicoccus sp.]